MIISKVQHSGAQVNTYAHCFPYKLHQHKLSQNENKKSVYALKMEKIFSADKSMKSVDSLIYHGLMRTFAIKQQFQKPDKNQQTNLPDI